MYHKHPMTLLPEFDKIVTRKLKPNGFLILGVQTNPGHEFKRAIWLANSWAESKAIKSFDILLFQAENYHGQTVPLYEHTGYARFVAVYYANMGGAFPIADYPAD